MSSAAPPTPPGKKNGTYKKLLEGSGKQDSPKVVSTITPPDETTSGGNGNKSFIRSWLEGNLQENKTAGEEGSSSISSTALSTVAPELVTGQVEDESTTSFSKYSELMQLMVPDATSSSGMVALHDAYVDRWYFLSMPAYRMVFGVDFDSQHQQIPPPPPSPPPPPPPPPENKITKPKTIMIGEVEVPLISPPTAEGYGDDEGAKEEEAGNGKGKGKKNKNKKKGKKK